MSGFTSFSVRYHKLKQDLQEIEEIEYAKLTDRHAELQQQSAELEEVRRRVQLKQSQILDPARWQEYAAFTAALTGRRQSVVDALSQVEEQLNEQQERLKQAFVEQEQWSHVVLEEKMSAEQVQLRREQRDADEEAIKRYRKGES